MKASRIAIAAGLFALCCSAQADSRNDRAPSARQEQRGATPPPASRPAANHPSRRGNAAQSRGRSDAESRGKSRRPSKPSNLRAEERPGPAMPIPIPGVG